MTASNLPMDRGPVASPPARSLGRALRRWRTLHLICDLSHRLLALSVVRARSFGCPADGMIGRALGPFNTAELATSEARLPDLGWHDLPSVPPIELESGTNGSSIVPVRPSRCRWTRLILSDDRAARLVETLNSWSAPNGCFRIRLEKAGQQPMP